MTEGGGAVMVGERLGLISQHLEHSESLCGEPLSYLGIVVVPTEGTSS